MTCHQCGACCKILLLPIPPGWPEGGGIGPKQVVMPVPENATPEGREYMVTHGATIVSPSPLHDCDFVVVPISKGRPKRVVWHGEPHLLVKSICQHLTAENRCDIYGSKPAICSALPRNKEDARFTPHCTNIA